MRFESRATYAGFQGGGEKVFTDLYDTRVKVAVPKALGGDDVGTSPLKIMTSAVASCVLLMVMNQLDESETESMTVDVSAGKKKVTKGKTPWLTDWVVQVNLPEADETNLDLIEAVLRGIHGCPMDALLEQAGERPLVLLNGVELNRGDI